MRRCRSCPRSRPCAGGSRRVLEGATITSARRSSTTADAAGRPAARRRRARRRADRGGRAPRQVPALAARERSDARRPSPDDGVACVTRPAAGCRTTRTGAPRLVLDTGADVGYRDVRRFGTWELLDAGHLRPYLAARLGPEPLAPSLHRRAPRDAPRGPACARQVGAARPAARRRGREHLRRRGALARPHPSAAPGRRARRGRGGAPASRGARRPSPRDRAPGLDAARLRDARRRRAAGCRDEFHVYGRLGEPCDRCGRRSSGSWSAGAERGSARAARSM